MHIHAILCARSSRCDYLDQWYQVTLVPLYMQHVLACLTLWRASARHSASMSICVVYTDTKPYRCTIAHQTRNSIGFLPWKWGILIALFSHWKLGENSVRCAMMHLKWSNCWIFATKIRWNATGYSPWKFGSDFKHIGKHWSGPQLLRNQTSKPNTFKALKLMPIARFQLPMSKNYGFTKTKDYLRTNVVGCLTHSLHITRILSSWIKIFFPSILD